MKKVLMNLALCAATLFGAMSVSAQEEKSPCETQCNVGLEIKSSEIWRGLQIGSGPAFKPTFAINAGSFSIGAEGTMCTGEDLGFESNIYAKYRFPFDLTLELTDYYAGGNWLGVNFDNIAKTHTIEPAIRYNYGKLQFYIALNFMENKEVDFYGHLAYDFDIFKVTLGGGDGVYTTSPVWHNGGDFAICNIGLEKETAIQINDRFALPITGGVALNPAIERFYAYAAIKFAR
ncbi:MAG: hypothetical protein J6V74_07895 [Bacteroidales bacterium]|nr:hypothetical protein [Bacteroidales bacterium]